MAYRPRKRRSPSEASSSQSIAACATSTAACPIFSGASSRRRSAGRQKSSAPRSASAFPKRGSLSTTRLPSSGSTRRTRSPGTSSGCWGWASSSSRSPCSTRPGTESRPFSTTSSKARKRATWPCSGRSGRTELTSQPGRFTSKPRLSVKELGERFDAIARDPRIKGVVLHLRTTGMPMATLQDLRELVAKLRTAGKRVVAWAPSYTTGPYYLACACDEILLMPTGMVQPLGFASTGVFLADGLARFGVGADFIQISPYKTAADPLAKPKMTPEFREQVTWLLDSQHGELVSAIAESRQLDEAAAKDLIDGSPYGDDVAVEKHAVDRVVGEEELPSLLGGRIGTWEQAAGKMRGPAPSLQRGKYVALMRIEGTIIDGRSCQLPVQPPIDIPLVGDDRAGDLSVVQLARQVAADKRAAAVVLYVNSRGGSSTASEAMRLALNVVAARKPVVVVMGAVAGAGGYYVATPGSWIIARPSTLTGSVGVLTGKIVTGAMWQKLLFNRETIAFGDRVTLYRQDRR